MPDYETNVGSPGSQLQDVLAYKMGFGCPAAPWELAPQALEQDRTIYIFKIMAAPLTASHFQKSDSTRHLEYTDKKFRQHPTHMATLMAIANDIKEEVFRFQPARPHPARRLRDGHLRQRQQPHGAAGGGIAPGAATPLPTFTCTTRQPRRSAISAGTAPTMSMQVTATCTRPSTTLMMAVLYKTLAAGRDHAPPRRRELRDTDAGRVPHRSGRPCAWRWAWSALRTAAQPGRPSWSASPTRRKTWCARWSNGRYAMEAENGPLNAGAVGVSIPGPYDPARRGVPAELQHRHPQLAHPGRPGAAVRPARFRRQRRTMPPAQGGKAIGNAGTQPTSCG